MIQDKAVYIEDVPSKYAKGKDSSKEKKWSRVQQQLDSPQNIGKMHKSKYEHMPMQKLLHKEL